MNDVYDVIYAPVVTEKSAAAIENDNVYTFIRQQVLEKWQAIAAAGAGRRI